MKPFNPFFSHMLSDLRTFEVMNLLSEDLAFQREVKFLRIFLRLKIIPVPPPLSPAKSTRIKRNLYSLYKHLYNDYKFM